MLLRKSRGTLRPAILTAVAIICLLGINYVHNHLYYNHTASEPIGFYWSTPVSRLRHGDIVLTCMTPALLRFADSHGFPIATDTGSPCSGGAEPFVKNVWATQGAHIRISNAGIWANENLLPHSQPLRTAPDGTPLPRPTPFTVRRGYVVAGSTVYRSFDSRYAGELKPLARLHLLFRDPLAQRNLMHE